MSVTQAPVGSKSLIDRVKGIIMRPDAEWRVIDTESATTGGLFAGYIALLAAIPAIAIFIGYSVFGVYGYRMPMVNGLEWAVARYIFTLIGAYIAALVIDALAPNFGGTRSKVQALKLVAYASTAAWLAGIFSAIPGLRILGVLGLYSIYLFYIGLPILMKSPPERSLGYTAVAVVCLIVIYVIIGAVTAAVMGGMGMGMMPGAMPHY
jgi:hypothetical protein